MSATTDTIASMNNNILQINRYLPYPFLIFGTIGVVLNLFIFTRRRLFVNSCTHYLLGNTLANLVVLYWVVLTRIFSDGYKIDPSVTSDAFCRVRYFFTYVSRALSTWFILFACIDRWLSSIKANRRFTTVSFARKVIIISTIIALLSFSNVLFLFGVQKSSTSVTCYAQAGIYRIVSDLQYLIFYAIGPAVAMLFFGLATLYNLREARRRVLPTGMQRSTSLARRNSQLLVMLLMQVALIIVFTGPFAGQKLYATFTVNVKLSAIQSAQENLSGAIVRILSYGPHSFGFFVYTLSAHIFRRELLVTMRNIFRIVRNMQSQLEGTATNNSNHIRRLATVSVNSK